MSLIHKALKRAEAEQRASISARSEARLEPSPEQDGQGARVIRQLPERGRNGQGALVVRHLPERGLRLAQFSSAGEGILSRGYEEIERLCSTHLDAAVRATGASVRVVLVAGTAGVDSAPAAMALAVALAERCRVRVALMDAAGPSGGVAELFQPEARGVLVADLPVDPTQPLSWIRRTPLDGVYFVRMPPSDSVGEGGADGVVAPAVARLLEFCHVVVLVANVSAEEVWAVSGLAQLALAAVFVTRGQEGGLERAWRGWFAPDALLYTMHELPRGGRTPLA
jgi:hypothetical protein